MNLLARGKGVEVHACGIIDPSGNGHLFIDFDINALLQELRKRLGRVWGSGSALKKSKGIKVWGKI